MDTTHVDAKELCIRSVHIMADGRIVTSGGPELALEVERNGYADLLAGAS